MRYHADLHMAAVRHLEFLKIRSYNAPGFRGSMCVIEQKFLSIGQTLLRYGDLSIFQYGGRPPSWILNSKF